MLYRKKHEVLRIEPQIRNLAYHYPALAQRPMTRAEKISYPGNMLQHIIMNDYICLASRKFSDAIIQTVTRSVRFNLLYALKIARQPAAEFSCVPVAADFNKVFSSCAMPPDKFYSPLPKIRGSGAG